MMRVAKFWSFGVCRLSDIIGLDGNQLLVLEKKMHLKKNQQRVFFPEIMTQMWRTLTLKSRHERRAGRNKLCGLFLSSRAVISGKSHCLLSFVFFFLFDFRVSCPFRNNF